MSLPPDVERLIMELRVALGVPAQRIVINLSDDGRVQSVEPVMVFRRTREKVIDKAAQLQA